MKWLSGLISTLVVLYQIERGWWFADEFFVLGIQTCCKIFFLGSVVCLTLPVAFVYEDSRTVDSEDFK